jgi:phosphate transport system permease protein
VIVRTSDEMLRLVPSTLREASLSLGIPQWKLTTQILIRAARSGIITGVLLALARVAGETAPLLFTAFGNRFWSPGLSQPISSLPVMIYTYAIAPYDDWHRQAWAAGLVLLGLVLVANVGTRLALSRGGSARSV